MKFSALPNTNIQVSKICLGTMTFGEQNSEKEGHEQLSYALDNEVNFIDTAEMYSVPGRAETQGSTEKIIGSWLKSTNNRDKVVIATKITGPSAGMPYIRKPLNFSPEQIDIAIEGSLNRLQTDYVDLYQLHWPERNMNMFGQRGYKHSDNEQWEDNFLSILQSMEKLIKSGKIKHFGLSNESPWGVMRFLHLAEKHNLPKPITIQNPYSLLNRTFEVGLAEVSMRENVKLLAYSPLAFGLLSGKYHNGTAKPEDRINKFTALSRYSSKPSFDATKQYIEIAKAHDLTPAQLSLAFINQQSFVTSNIIGATNLDQLKENISSAKIELSNEIMNKIEHVHNMIPNPAP